MDAAKSLDNCEVICHLIRDIYSSLSGLTPRDIRLTVRKVRKRFSREGMGFLTKTHASLGKCLDQALSGNVAFDPIGFKKKPNSTIPYLYGELFERVFTRDGLVLPDPDIQALAGLRQLLYTYYKYELPYDQKLEEGVIQAFVNAEDDLVDTDKTWDCVTQRYPQAKTVLTTAKNLLARVLCNFDPTNVIPGHGPGTVATRERMHQKYTFDRWNERLQRYWPMDAYCFASLGHVADSRHTFKWFDDIEAFARVVLVPKDSRGPRLISCEPLEFQWIQQGIMRSLVPYIEHHPLTKGRVNFTRQDINQRLALHGSIYGSYATLDLKEASDRVSLQLVERLFPDNLKEALRHSRSLGTELPTGDILTLRKFAPMGSALCFPVMALTIWAIVCSVVPVHLRKKVFVYGDDVIVPTQCVNEAIEGLEFFGLKINLNKSFTSGFFRESCGLDTFKGVDVTPVRLRTVWSSRAAARAYASWICYSNAFLGKGYVRTARYIAEELVKVYRHIPYKSSYEDDGVDSYPVLRTYVPDSDCKVRWNRNSQKLELRVLCLTAEQEEKDMEGWKRLLRYFTEAVGSNLRASLTSKHRSQWERFVEPISKWDSGWYTDRDRVHLVSRWR